MKFVPKVVAHSIADCSKPLCDESAPAPWESGIGRSAHRGSRFQPAAAAPFASLVLVGLLLAVPGRRAWAYDVQHNIGWNLPTAVDEITFSYKAKARARTRRCKDNPPRLKNSEVVTHAIQSLAKLRTALAPNSAASAHADAEITSITPNPPIGESITGSVHVYGTATPDLTGCSSNRRKKTAVAKASSKSKLEFTSTGMSGQISYSGTWSNTNSPTGSAVRGRSRKVLRDPVIVTLADHTTGITSDWTLCSVRSVVGNGEMAWRLRPEFCRPPPVLSSGPGVANSPAPCRTLRNNAREMIFDAVIDVPVIPPTERGTLHLVAKHGLITESTRTGIFTGLTGVPIVGASSTFEFLFPDFQLSYALPGDTTHNNTVTLGVDGGAHEAGLPAGNPFDECTVLTDIGNGFDDADISAPQAPDVDLGFTAAPATVRVAVPIEVPAGAPTRLDAVLVPVFQQGAPAGVGTITAAYARLWFGDPMQGGTIMAGDLTTNRLDDLDEDIDMFRVAQSTPTDSLRRLQEAVVALDDMPPLPPGRYYLELAFDGANNLPEPEVVPCPWANDDDNSLVFDVQANQWSIARDSQSNRDLEFCATVMAGSDTTAVPGAGPQGMVALLIALAGLGSSVVFVHGRGRGKTSDGELDVVTVYTAAGASKQVETMDVERVVARRSGGCPDLVVDRVGPPTWDARARKSQITVVIRNAGSEVAGPTLARLVDVAGGIPGGATDSVVLPTPPLAAGASTTLTFTLNYWVFHPDARIEVTADYKNDLPECDETNNVGTFEGIG